MKVVEIGKTAEGRAQLMAIVTSPANHARLARYKDIASRLAHAEGLTDAQARALAKEGKAVVWIDGGLHATETFGAQQLGQIGLRDGEPHRRRDAAHPRRRASSCSCTRTRTATTSSPTGTCATPRPEGALARRAAAALPEVHRPRQQPRLLRVDAGRDGEHEPRAVPRVVSAAPLQPPPERAGGHGRLLAAAARPVQLQPRPGAHPRPAVARRGDAHAARGRGQARRDDALAAGRTTGGGTAASATPRRSTTRSRC